MLVAPYHHSDRSNLAPAAGVHCINDPDMVAHTKRSLAIQVPPEDDTAGTNLCLRSATEKILVLLP